LPTRQIASSCLAAVFWKGSAAQVVDAVAEGNGNDNERDGKCQCDDPQPAPCSVDQTDCLHIVISFTESCRQARCTPPASAAWAPRMAGLRDLAPNMCRPASIL
jgi:hypothetical protein